ncbi:HTH domain-containing protein [Sphingomonas sp.]|uniref:HTH domain-containing protein n=1 Tax=Sphingomonas sp. TaxID=28214 RepID=UPI003869F614
MAEAVLRRARTPLTTRQIMDIAFLSDLVPAHLHGFTQYKTVGARLSEDILHLKRKSRFFRTKPGRFFLREFISDRTLPLEYRTPIVAARRRRQLRRKNVASLDFAAIESLTVAATGIDQLINKIGPLLAGS